MTWDFIHYLSLAPIQRGAMVILVSSVTFPLIGVLILKLNLVPYRFMLMHSSLLGSALGLAFNTSPLVVGLLTNGVVITTIGISSTSRYPGMVKKPSANATSLVSFFLVATVGLAIAIIYRFDVPAMEALSLFWGNVYALSPMDLRIVLGFSGLIVIVVKALFPGILALLFDRQTAFTSGVPVRALELLVLYGLGLTIQLAMGLIGALMLDALIILPAIVAGHTAKSALTLFVHSSIWGLVIGVIGFFSSLIIDIPASSGITLTGATCLGLIILHKAMSVHYQKLQNQKKQQNQQQN
jgi:zinc transport system permease protein